MASPTEKSSSSSRSITPLMLMPGRIMIAYDATKNHNIQEFKQIIHNIRVRNGMTQEVDTITVLGVLHKVLHPMGFQMQIGPDSFIGTRVRAIKEDVSRKVDVYVGMLQHSAEECEGDGVHIEVKIVVGAPIKKVIVQEAAASNATWVVLDRTLRKELRFYLKHVPCKVALVLDNLSLEILRPYHSDKATVNIEHKRFYSLSKLVPQSHYEYNSNDEQTIISPSHHESISSQQSSDSGKSSVVSSLTSISKEQSFFSPGEFGENTHLEKSDSNIEVESEYDDSETAMQKQRNTDMDSDALLDVDEMKMGLNLMSCSYSEIKIATNDFSSDNLVEEGEFGAMYKGQLKDGQLITIKVQKEANTQCFTEFHSEVDILRFACHKNIVMLLGYGCKDNLNIFVYEYICNKSLEWHLFDNTEHILEWHRRHAIAIGIAKGLRFLHEECRGSPIIHWNVRLSNILLTHEFVPLLGDCSLAKWKANKFDRKPYFHGNLEYLAPECAENGICSVKTDVYAFGIVLIQLISGRKAADSMRDNHQKSLRQWVMLSGPSNNPQLFLVSVLVKLLLSIDMNSTVFQALPWIKNLALDELVDPRLGDSYSTYELYQMAKAAQLCVQNKPEKRPTIGEILRLLEGKNDHLRHLTQQFIPHYRNLQRPALLQKMMSLSMSFLLSLGTHRLITEFPGIINQETASLCKFNGLIGFAEFLT
ncbi:hypothetical protein BUALT_Bualt08G0110300 [Buddleja alternifolia]|uniref:Protein kinase domain-containing protein n=1 Tax=Buddleja alternifolia TaxID=168488 RepID=A0AAV6XCN2_9LAMI|nr:hypothetical protein BUALT_Bualt08G0110300 [Buddleja alternifolia]